MEKIIKDLNGLHLINKQNYICIDLDATLIATVFTNDHPNKYMKFYKRSFKDNRYTVLRPGVVNFLNKLNDKNIKIGLLTDASSKRAVFIAKQFNILSKFNYIIARECLYEIEKNSGFSRRQKPSDIINYKCLIDDYDECKEINGKKCIKVDSFLAIYNNLELQVKGCRKKYINYDDAIEEESRYVESWYDKIMEVI